jgi:nuclear transport factor 2 (NTF2) superfamily protein
MREFAQRYTEAWCSGVAARVAEFYSLDGYLRVNEGESAVGRGAITEVAQGFMTAFPDMAVAFDELRAVDGKTEYHWTLTGTNTGPGGTGRSVRISGYETWTVGEDGLIAASEGRFDAVEYQRQLEGR